MDIDLTRYENFSYSSYPVNGLIAVKNNDLTFLKFFIKKCEHLVIGNVLTHFFVYSCYYNHPKIIKYLFKEIKKRDAALRLTYFTCLEVGLLNAVHGNHFELVKFLFKKLKKHE